MPGHQGVVGVFSLKGACLGIQKMMVQNFVIFDIINCVCNDNFTLCPQLKTASSWHLLEGERSTV